MGNDPNGSEKQQATGQKAPQSPSPSLANKEEERQGDADGDGLRPKGNHQKPPKTLWGRFKAWVFPVAFTDAVMLLLTAFIALGTIVSAVAIAFQWSEMHKGGADTKAIADAAKTQACAARRFAKSAEGINTEIGIAEGDFAQMAQNSADSIQATQEAMRQDQRAWMGLDSVTGKPEGDKPFDIMLALKNTGRTPARSVVIYSTYDPVATGMPPEFKKIGDPIKVGFVSPNAMHFFIIHPSQGKIVTKEQLPIFQTYSFYVFGILTYEDIFRKKHWFTYCLSMEPDGSRYDYCPNHNDVGDGDPPFALPKTRNPN